MISARVDRHLVLSLLFFMALMGLLTAAFVAPARGGWAAHPSTAAEPVVTATLTIANSTPITNRPMFVTVTFTSHAVSITLLNPLYALEMPDAPGLPLLVPEHPMAWDNGPIGPGESRTTLFTLYPVTGGQITITALATVTVPLSPTGQMRMEWETDPISPTIPTPSLPASIIHEAATTCMELLVDLGYFHIEADETGGSFGCAYAPGHSFDTGLKLMESSNAALAAFNAGRGDRELKSFHCHASYSWSDRPYGGPSTYSGHVWTAGRWLAGSTAQDDTHYGGAASGSESLYRIMDRRGLIEPCTGTYLPVVNR